MTTTTKGSMACPASLPVLRENLPTRRAAVRHRHRPAGAVVHWQLGVNAVALIDGGADIASADRAIFHKRGVSVGGPANRAAADAGPGEEDRVAIGPVV